MDYVVRCDQPIKMLSVLMMDPRKTQLGFTKH